MGYEVKLALPKGEVYFGTYQLTFDLSSIPTKPLFVDFRGIKIGCYIINGVNVEDAGVFNDHTITMPAKHL